MQRDRQTVGSCPRCKQGTVTCFYNRFVKLERIDSWEHRCSDCGYRETQALRSDPSTTGGGVCPYCGREVH